MPVIQVKDKQHTLKPGQTRIGAGPGVDVSVSNDETLGLQAVLELTANNQVVIRRARDNAAVRVNGIPLVEPTPLMHGDKIDVAGTEIVFSEDKKVGSTQFVSASDVAGIAAKRSGPARATGTTGGRLVSLVDGKEYQIPSAGVSFGREAGSDVVVAQPEVSRKHATIAPSESGYVLTDHSTNGVWVNGARVQGSQILARADIVRVGTEEFRFYADLVKGTPAASASAVPSTPAPAPPRAAPSTPPSSPPSSPPSIPAPAVSPSPPPAAPPPVAAAPAPPPSVPAAQSQWAPPPSASAPSMPSAAPAAPQPPAAAPAPPAVPPAGPPPAASHAGVQPAMRREPSLTPPAKSRTEPPTAPSGVRGPAKGKREPTLATREAKSGGVSPLVWVLLLIVVAVGAYLLGQRGR